jgi:hypothetical protein
MYIGFRQKLIDNIIEIKNSSQDLDSNIINIENIALDFSSNKYSAKKKEIWHIIINNERITRNINYIFKYKCINCASIHIISTTQFIRKINKNSQYCYLCRNNNIDKRIAQSLFMIDNNNASKNKLCIEDNIYKSEKSNFLEIRKSSLELFNSYDSDFKDNYFNFHLTDDDYLRISKNLKSYHNNNLADLNNYEYWSIYKTNNQMNFTSMIYDKINNTLFKAHQPIFKCDNCNLFWRAKSIEQFKNCYKIMCKDCSFCNNIFKIRITHNINNQQILYQSKLELKFIKWCNNNGKLILNGPKIPYFFDNKKRIYQVDFQYNNILIEIKDNHIWHKRDLESGKWSAKEKAINNLINDNKYEKYLLIEPKNWLKQLDLII